MESTLHIPSNIFEEMAGMKEINSTENTFKEEFIKNKKQITPINKKRLKSSSLALFSNIQGDMCKYFYKIAKKILQFQEKEAPIKKRRPIIYKIIKKESFSKTLTRSFIKKFNFWKPLIKATWSVLKFIVQKLFKLSKWLGKLTTDIISKLLKTFANISKKIISFFKKSFKTLLKIISKISKHIFKNIKPILQSIWKIIKKLFFKGKPMKKMFKDEPSDIAMKQPELPKKKNKMKLKLKAIGKKSTFIMKALKKIFKTFKKIFWKIITKIFKKIIKKIITVIGKMIIKFIAGQIIGSFLPGIGNIILGGISIALMAKDVFEIVNFIKDTSNEMVSLYNDLSKEDKSEEVNEETYNKNIDINDMNISEIKSYMETLVSNGKENSSKYLEAKERYLELLIETYKNTDNEEIIKIIRYASETGYISTASDIDLATLPNNNGIKNLDINKLEKAIAEQQKRLTDIKWKNKAKNIFNENEFKTLLTGEDDGGIMWYSIWRDIIYFIKVNIPLRVPTIDTFKQICKEVTFPYPKEILLEYNFKSKDWFNNISQKEIEAQNNSNKFIKEENNSYEYSSDIDFNKQDNLEEVLDKSKKYKFSLKDESQSLIDAKKEENILQKYKYFKWSKILEFLSKKELKALNF